MIKFTGFLGNLKIIWFDSSNTIMKLFSLLCVSSFWSIFLKVETRNIKLQQ